METVGFRMVLVLVVVDSLMTMAVAMKSESLTTTMRCDGSVEFRCKKHATRPSV